MTAPIQAFYLPSLTEGPNTCWLNLSSGKVSQELPWEVGFPLCFNRFGYYNKIPEARALDKDLELIELAVLEGAGPSSGSLW